MSTAQGVYIAGAPLLRERTSIQLGGPAIAELRFSSLRALDQLPGLVTRLGGRVAPFGAGTNIIAGDGQLPLLLLRLCPELGLKAKGEKGERVLLRADGAMRLPVLLGKAASMGLAGLESLAGIPGSVGGAIAMNAGSYGMSIGERVHSVEVFSPLLGLVERRVEDFDFSYRSCRLRGHEGWFLIVAVTLLLDKGERMLIRDRMRTVYTQKKAGQPVTAKSAGCVFKNPAPDAPAGRLLEQAGLKGLAEGGMRFSSLHANFLVNEGAGRSEQALSLIDLAKERVLARTGYRLETEVRIWL